MAFILIQVDHGDFPYSVLLIREQRIVIGLLLEQCVVDRGHHLTMFVYSMYSILRTACTNDATYSVEQPRMVMWSPGRSIVERSMKNLSDRKSQSVTVIEWLHP